ncbi:DUF2149 domain-containing protein [Peristeroidobacter agariperforans]|uniref:DUF2149 domain-containing protein n=1 Tax=Peristeroidobacter agariperforans TaxID=268404 RepID=UPI0018E59030|nr:DUF2149 domain-containing protein [Peristeroidobacter agariperforans]
MRRRWSSVRFDETPEDPQASLVNLVDIMLVFICGLIVALVSAQPVLNSTPSNANGGKQVVEPGRELAELPEGLRGQAAGAGMEPVGQVYRDPKTGKLILVGQ